MAGKVTFSVLGESHEGSVGSDWRYWIEVKVFNRGLKGHGRIEVPKHNLPSGVTQEPPGQPAVLEMPVGDCNDNVKIKIRAEATEVDLFSNDSGLADIDVILDFPTAGEAPLVQERDICIGVSESPRSSLITLKTRLVLSCE
ncbi:MAG: hypothetical protein PVF46_04300 [Lysobacterales bacterium]|jgi:hypothetical protein